jgi:hypothetical protein
MGSPLMTLINVSHTKLSPVRTLPGGAYDHCMVRVPVSRYDRQLCFAHHANPTSHQELAGFSRRFI